MKSTKRFLFVSLLFAVALSLTACNNNMSSGMDESLVLVDMASDEEMRSYSSSAGESAPTPSPVDFIATKAADGTFDGNKKFIRTANLRFSVANVVSATHAIEDIIIANRGFIINSTLSNDVLSYEETMISRDSVLMQTINRLNGSLTLRVQHSLLDATLREIAPLAEHIESRRVNADDVTFRLLSNNLEQARKRDKSARLKNISGPGRGHKLEDLLEAEEAIDQSRHEADAAFVAEKMIYDDIEYSTITITLWQEQPTVFTSMRAVIAAVPEYRQGFFESAGQALAAGWYGLLAVVEVLLTIWPLLLVIGGAVFAGLYFRRKKKKLSAN